MFNKKILTTAMVILFNSGGFLVQNVIQNNMHVAENNIVDFDKLGLNAFKYYEDLKCYGGWAIDKIEDFKINDLVSTNVIGIPIGKPEIISNNKEYTYIGEDILKNYNQQEQTLSTISFKKSMSEEVSASLTAGISFTNEMNFLIDKTKVEVSLSGTIAKQSSVFKEFIVPSQNIKVPARSQVVVTGYWSQVKMKQSVNISCDFSGNIVGTVYVHSTLNDKLIEVWNEKYSLGDIFNPFFNGYPAPYPNLPKSLKINSDTQSMHFNGGMDCFAVDAGSLYQIQVGPSEPITDL